MRPALTKKSLSMPDSWRDIPWGEYYRAVLEDQLKPWWPKMFGFHLLKVGHLSSEIDTTQCRISHQVKIAPEGLQMHLLGELTELPLAEKSIDVCLMSQVLAYSKDPHQSLREADRVLIDDGWLIISGFNPLSLIGLGKLLPWNMKRQPYNCRLFSMLRLLDWLSLLNYEILYQRSFQPLPWRGASNCINQKIPFFGCMNVIVARKRTIPLTMTPKKFALLKPNMNNNVVGATRSYPKKD